MFELYRRGIEPAIFRELHHIIDILSLQPANDGQIKTPRL